MRRERQIERHYYDPGVTPMPVNLRPKAKKAKPKKKRPTLFDRARKWAAKGKRERKAERRRGQSNG